MAPESSQKAIEEYGRSFYDELIESVPTETPLETADLVYAFERWDREIGGSKIKEE
jgi:putative spermidine/putrescine transport system substrate-binding protein